MKKITFAILLTIIVFSLNAKNPQDSLVSRVEFNDAIKTMQDSINQIGRRVNNANETYEIAKNYSESANSLIDKILGVFALFGFSLVGLYFWTTTQYKKALAKQFKKQKENVYRLINTETNTMKIKEKAKLLFLFKEGETDSNIRFNKMLNTVLKEFDDDNIIKAYTNDLSSINDKKYKKFLRDKSKLKVLIANDDLFREFLEKNSYRIKDDKIHIVENFIQELESKNIGFALFGKTSLRDFKYELKAFSNEPYSFYANLNNLLKYMVVAKEIEL